MLTVHGKHIHLGLVQTVPHGRNVQWRFGRTPANFPLAGRRHEFGFGHPDNGDFASKVFPQFVAQARSPVFVQKHVGIHHDELGRDRAAVQRLNKGWQFPFVKCTGLVLAAIARLQRKLPGCIRVCPLVKTEHSHVGHPVVEKKAATRNTFQSVVQWKIPVL